MGKEITKFSDIEVEKHKFHQHKIPIYVNIVYLNVNIGKILYLTRFLLVKKV